MTKEALKLALEALGLAKHSHGVLLLSDPPQEAWKTYQVDAALSKAITAIKEALANEALEKMAENARELGLDYETAQPEHGWTPERIAGMARLKEAQDKKLAQPEQEPTTKAGELRAMKTELWKQPEQEPVAWISATELLVMRGNALGGAKDWRVNLGLEPEEGEVGLYTTPPQGIYYTPPQRTWIGLTEDEILSISAECAFSHQHMDIHFARAIEAKLKAKNT